MKQESERGGERDRGRRGRLERRDLEEGAHGDALRHI